MESFARPSLIEVWRASSGGVAVGDHAVVAWSPRLLDALMTGSPPPAAGTHPMSGVPVGVMTEAALIACGREDTGIHILVFAEISFRSPVPRDRTWIAEATVQGFGRRHARVEVRLRDGDRLLCEGVLGVARVVDGRAQARLASGEMLPGADEE